VKDAELQRWWPDLGTVVAELRRIDRSDVADLLLDAVRAGATSSEIIGGIGIVLRDHRALYTQISRPAAAAWDAVMADVNRAYPVGRLSHWFTRITRRLTRRAQRP
jgi:hypothetical protein